MRLILITIALFVFWLILSGQNTPWFIISGLVLSIAVVIFGHRQGVTDAEGFPFGMVPRGFIYWPWLLGEIFKSGLVVTRVIINPRLSISPRIRSVDALEQTAVGLAVYASSITLTPGTVTIEASERRRLLWIHALEQESADAFDDDEMNRRVAWFEGGSKP